MKETQANAVIAISTVVGGLIMLIALSFAIGKWSLGGHQHEVIVRFPLASGLNANSAGDTVSTDNPLPGHNQTGVYAGIQHSF